MPFKVGDKVVYPHHGAAIIEKSEKKMAFGEKQEYLVLRLAYGDLILMVPADNTEGVGLRDVINDEEVEEVFAVLRKKEARMPTNWSRRYKNHSEKLRSGDIYQVAEVVRNLSIRDKDKGLSAGEKRMLTRARQILVSELTFALNVDEETAEERLNDALDLSDAARSRRGDGVADRRGRGRGQRFGGPKQFADLDGRPVLAWAVEACRPRRRRRPGGARRLRTAPATTGPTPSSPGGATRADSVRAGLAAVPADADVVVVHDAARPLAAPALRRRGRRRGRRRRDGAVPGVPPRHAQAVDGAGNVTSTLDRARWSRSRRPRPSGPRVLRGPRAAAPRPPTTPRWSRRSAARSGRAGRPANLKITDPEDLARPSAARGRVSVRIGQGFDVHRFSDDPHRRSSSGPGSRARAGWPATPTPTPSATRWPTRCWARPGSATSAATSPTPTRRGRGPTRGAPHRGRRHGGRGGRLRATRTARSSPRPRAWPHMAPWRSASARWSARRSRSRPRAPRASARSAAPRGSPPRGRPGGAAVSPRPPAAAPRTGARRTGAARRARRGRPRPAARRARGRAGRGPPRGPGAAAVGRRTVRRVLLAEGQDPSPQLDQIEELAGALRVPVGRAHGSPGEPGAHRGPQGVALARPLGPSRTDLAPPDRPARPVPPGRTA